MYRNSHISGYMPSFLSWPTKSSYCFIALVEEKNTVMLDKISFIILYFIENSENSIKEIIFLSKK